MSGERPKKMVADVTRILAECYNLKALTVTELDSYDCQRQNFEVEVVGDLADLPNNLNKPFNSSEEDSETPQSGHHHHHHNDDGDRSTEIEDETKRSCVWTAASAGIVERCRPVDNSAGRSIRDESGGSECRENRLLLVLKVFNGAHCTADRLPTTRRQVECSQFLRGRGFNCPLVIRTRHGELLGSTATAHPGSPSCTLLMTRLKGQQLGAYHSRISSRVLFEVGALLAHLHVTLQEGDSQYLETDPSNPWIIENLHLLSDYLHCIQDEEERLMLDGIISKFKQIRQDKFHTLQKGIIHGDFHDLNIIVDWENPDPSLLPPPPPPPPSLPHPPTPHCHSQRSDLLQKYGVIDFQEMSVSYPALELSRLMADMMLVDCHQVSPLEVGGHVLAGYTSVDRGPVEQFGQCLLDAALACLAQYVVLSLHDYQSGGQRNDYCLVGTEDAGDTLRRLRSEDPHVVYVSWGDVLTGYGLDNPFTV